MFVSRSASYGFSDAAAAVSSSRYEPRVSVENGPPALFFLRIPIRSGNQKLAQEGSMFARKRNSTNILAAGRWFRSRYLQPS
jgi:hypothetical protein